MSHITIFTIQNVPIKYVEISKRNLVIRNLQYKMFLLNQITPEMTIESLEHLQYKMFLLNTIISLEQVEE